MDNDTEVVPHYFSFNETNTSFPTFLNLSEDVPTKPNLSSYYPILAAELALSILCSIVIIVIYVIIGEHKTIPGKNVITISLCLIVTYVLLSVDLVLRGTIPFPICMTMGIVVQTAFLATFFWINIMSFDIMKTMASIRPDKDRSSAISSKFWKYNIYAWAMTALCVIPAIVVDQTDFFPVEYKPKFGQMKCWLSGQVAFLIYFNLPVGLTLFANCVFFAITARTIVKVRNATTILAANRHKKRFRLCMKLVLIMGLVWITEFIPWITGIYFLYAIAGMLNCLHGVYMFLIFICKKRIMKQVVADSFCCNRTNEVPEPKKKQSPSLDTISTFVSSERTTELKFQ